MSTVHAEEFAIPSADGVCTLTGVIERGRACGEPSPTLLIVPGGWFAERDGFMGDSGTDADLMYRRIAHRVVQEGFPVVRYDNRGVRGNELTAGVAGDSSQNATQRYFSQCVDSTIRRSVTASTGAADLVSVYRHVEAREDLCAGGVAVLAHSEGGLSVARSIRQGATRPLGLVLVGVAAESPASLLRWQTVGRYTDTVMGWDHDGDGVVTAANIERAYEAGTMLAEVGVGAEDLNPPPDGWTLDLLQAFFMQRYEEMKADALATDPSAPYPKDTGELNYAAASYAWWRQWFTDDESVVGLLKDYPRCVAFHCGALDSQAPGARQVAFARAARVGSHWKLVLHEGRGHTLRTGEPARGPMDDEAEDMLVDDVLAILRPA